MKVRIFVQPRKEWCGFIYEVGIVSIDVKNVGDPVLISKIINLSIDIPLKKRQLFRFENKKFEITKWIPNIENDCVDIYTICEDYNEYYNRKESEKERDEFNYFKNKYDINIAIYENQGYAYVGRVSQDRLDLYKENGYSVDCEGSIIKLKEEIKNNYKKKSLDSANNTSGNLFTKVISHILRIMGGRNGYFR